MARMSEKDARENIVRFSDPRLHRVGFGINLTVFNPKERTVLIYRKGSYGGIDPGLSVVPFDELQPLKLEEFCILANGVMDTAKHILKRDDLFFTLRNFNGELEAQSSDGEWYSVFIFHIISQINWMIELLQLNMPQKDVERLVGMTVE